MERKTVYFYGMHFEYVKEWCSLATVGSLVKSIEDQKATIKTWLMHVKNLLGFTT